MTDVAVVPPQKDNKMQSFWLAETLKYLYLIFSPAGRLPQSEWVFNTEAHPLKISGFTVLTNGTRSAVESLA